MSRRATTVDGPRSTGASPRRRTIAPRRCGHATARAPATRPQPVDPVLVIRAGVAFVLANMRYWTGVARLAGAQLRRWRDCAQAIVDPVLRALALQKLDEEGFNAQLAAMLATLAPRAQRTRAVEAIVALEVLYDYLDGLTESPTREAPHDGSRLFSAFTDAVAPGARTAGDYYRHHPHWQDGGYLQQLVGAARTSLAALPGNGAVAETLHRSAARGAEAQLRIHGACLSGSAQLERWARRHAAHTSLQWQEFLAGAACSVLAVHALVAAAADRRTTRERAVQLDRIYLSISVLPTVLDSVIDYDRDARAGQPGYVRHYDDRVMLARRLDGVVEDVLAQTRGAPHGAHHVMTMTGVVAYYLSAPTATSAFARPVTEQIRAGSLRPLIAPVLAMLRAWRVAKRVRARAAGERAGRADRRT
jgi:tetraprenyl-beta-curcumene synthase